MFVDTGLESFHRARSAEGWIFTLSTLATRKCSPWPWPRLSSPSTTLSLAAAMAALSAREQEAVVTTQLAEIREPGQQLLEVE